MKMQLPEFLNPNNTHRGVIQKFWSSAFKAVAILLIGLSVNKANAQVVFNETFSNVTNVNYSTAINPSTFNTLFDNTGWTSSSSSGQSCTEAGTLTIGRSGSSGGNVSTPQMDLSGTDIVILSFKLKFYGTNSITGSTSSRVIVQLNGSDVFSGQKGVVSIPAGQADYNSTEFKTYNIILTGGTATSTITFRGTSSNYAYVIDDVVVTKAAMPTVATTTPPATVNFTSAVLGGTINATGLPISESGIVWSTSNTNPTTANNKVATDPLVTSGAYSVTLSSLTPGVTYYYNSYVVTPAGTVYGTASSFTTPVPDYKLTSNTGNLDFGGVTINTTSVLSYTVSGKNLEPASDNILVTAPAGFTIALSSNGTFGPTLSLPYSGGILAPTTIYVKFAPTIAFATTTGTITLSGGGVTSDYIINEKVSGRGKLVDPAVASNVGNDFWLGFGYHASMNSTGSGRARLSVYVSNPSTEKASVMVEIPGLGYTAGPVDIDGNGGFFEFGDFPYGDGTAGNATNAPDSRLYYTGTSNRAIHVYSTNGVPVSVWLYDYSSGDAAAGSLVFPTNTWNTSYTVQTIGGGANSAGSPNSYFFVIAQEDDTQIEITPTGDILDSVAINTIETSSNVKYSPGTGTFTVTLNTGQVFNAISTIVGGVGTDLSGTLIKSTNCKKFAVFAGNGRNGIGSDLCNYTTGAGTDNLIQQMFPKVAWGTKYYTVPTKHMEYNTYRITVDDPATQVWVNKSVNPTALSGYDAVHKFYQIYTNLPSVIESDKPISVTQFISSESCGSNETIGNNGQGDPEMIILSPAAQAINKVTVVSTTIKNGNGPGAHYINVVVPNAGINTFKLDYDYLNNVQPLVDTGSSSYVAGAYQGSSELITIDKAFQPYPFDANYSWAKFKVLSDRTHTLESAIPFNAIAYGTAKGESYGFNAGTQVNDLTTPLILNNPFGDSLNSLNTSKPLTTCRGTEVALSATLPFANVEGKPIVFSYGGNANISPNADDVIANPVLSHTFDFNGQTFYVYKLAQKHVFSANGDYQINVTYFNPSPSDGCGQGGSNKTISYTIKVVDGIAPAYTIDYNTCVSNTVTITDATNGLGYDIVKWNWSYDNGSKPLPSGQDIVKNPVFTNPANNTAANVKLIAINSIGCYGELQKSLPTPTIPQVVFNNQFAPVCSNAAVITLNQATPAGGVYSGAGVTVNQGVYTFNPAAQGVSTSAPNVITYTVTGESGCSNSGTNTIVVNALPVVSAGPNLTTVINKPITITGTSSVEGVYTWSPSTGITPTNALVTEAQIGELGTYTYTLSVQSNNCTASDDMTLTVVPDVECLDPMRGFTPNGDGHNDRWIVFNDEGCFVKVQVDVYNRYGGLVYHSDKYTNNWIGEFKGKAVPDATYYYVVKATQANKKVIIKTGNVTIVR
ncbi:gliding motility-associated C-terminal domain-containing protein [Ferruginibacter sp. SUN002]|uniref:T9SS type B sorting domain-containing protein n=1 Tax=Ferruginibacter sp. SUN002 TaxID=2937789 RepID=UPI003D3663CA